MFLNAGLSYGADVLVGAGLERQGDPGIVEGPGGSWHRPRFIGIDYEADEGSDFEVHEKPMEDHGYYPYRAEHGEPEGLQAAGTVEAHLSQLMRDEAVGRVPRRDRRRDVRRPSYGP
jgi:hypothetical protein